uniref:Ig-like domain-containing protein n=1 Tax=Anopheles stephensi TaxID=30069 RepID=A0A182YDR8_ANOST
MSYENKPESITKPLQTFSEEQFLQELSDDRGNSQGTHHPTVRSRPPYLGNLHLGFHHPHHHQPSEASENEIYDSDESNLLRTPLDRGPHFDLSASKNITALVGKTAYLNCRVKNIGNKTIRYPQKRDTGVYECQISTTPPVGHSMFLSVVEPITTIVGVPDLYINTGSTVNLTCIVRNSPEPPSTIIWTHNNQVRRRGSISGALVEINYDSPRGGVSVITEKGETTTSYLLIQRARTTDTGKYVCSPSNADPSTINVHILNGEHPAAMQHAGQLRIGDPLYVFVLWLISYLFGRR